MSVNVTAHSADAIRDLIEAGRLHDALLAADHALEDATGQTRVMLLVHKAIVLVSTGAAQSGLDVALEASALAATLNLPEMEAEALIALGYAYQALDNHLQCFEAVARSERLADALGNTELRSRALRRLGVSCSVLGRHEQAAQILQQAVTMMDGVGRTVDWCHARYSLLNARSRAAEAQVGEDVDQRAHFQALVADWRAFADEMAARGLVRLEAMAEGNCGVAAHQAGLLEVALHILQKAATRYIEVGLRGHQAFTQVEIGELLLKLNRPADAASVLQAAIAMLELGNPREQIRAHNALAEALEQLDDIRGALTSTKRARMLERQLHDDEARTVAQRREQREEIAGLAAQWSKLAEQDELTQLANRRGFDQRILQMTTSASSAHPCTLLLFDLDYFKRINDTFGHAVGDQVLKRFAEVLTNDRRVGDLAARVGGEEFALLLPCGLIDAAEVAERVRDAVAKTDWQPWVASFAVTVSVGTACTTELAVPTASTLFELADKRLYMAKAGGRNRVVFREQ